MFSECAELAIFLYVFFAIFWYLRKKQSDLEKKTNIMMRRWNHNVILSRGISRFLSAVCRRWPWPIRRWNVFSAENFQATKRQRDYMSVQADGSSWKGRPKHISSLLYSTKHVRSPHWPGNHRLHTADKKREMPPNKMTL